MAKCNDSAHELLSKAFNPRVAVITSPEAQALCGRNNLTFTQLISPFSTLTTSLNWHEPGGALLSPRYFKITPVDIASWKPPQNDTQSNRKQLYNKVAQILPHFPTVDSQTSNYDPVKHSSIFQTCSLGKPGLTPEYTVEVPLSTPWFESWRELFLKLQSEQHTGQHEFMKYFLGCIFVISSSEGKNAEEITVIIGKLSKLQQQHQSEWPNAWFLPTILKFYLIIHDNSAEDSKSAETLYQSIRTMYTGNACYMLKINSGANINRSTPASDPWNYLFEQTKPYDTDTSHVDEIIIDPVNISNLPHPLSPDEEVTNSCFPPVIENGPVSNAIQKDCHAVSHGELMTPEDLQNVQIAVNEFIGKALFPYVERHTRILHESIVNRRSVSKSFFGATKRLFGTGSKSIANVVYGSDSLEVTSRKLADLYFLFGNYPGAYQLYHQLKKDFQSDQAWSYYASCLEMAALSHFMMTQLEAPLLGARSFPVHYVNEAIKVYSENCRMPDSAIRCAILCFECLKQLENYGEAASVLIRMTSEDCDLRSALMLEQAAYSFIKLNSPRKFALHSVLAGHRYAKAGLRSHSLNSYLQAAQIYYGKGWRFAEDHVMLTIAKHKSFLQMHRGLAQHLKSILRTPTPQSPMQLQIYYNEFLSMMAKLYSINTTVENFFIPSICSTGIRLRIGNTDLPVGEVEDLLIAEDATAPFWDSLEEQVVKECVDHTVVRFKPSRLVFDESTVNTVHPSVPCNEFLYIEVPLQNPLSVEITVQNIRLKFEPGTTVSCTTLNELVLQPNETKIVRFRVVSSKRGRITYEWLLYELKSGNLVCPFQQKFTLKGPRLNSTKVEKASKVYAKDFRNEINVIEQMPLLQAEVENLPSSLYHSQLIPFNFILEDKSKDSSERKRISRIILASDGMKEFLEITQSSDYTIEEPRKNYSAIKLYSNDSATLVKIPCTFRAPQFGDFAKLKVLIVYQVNKKTEEHHPHLASTPPSLSKLEWEPMHRVIKVSIKVPLQPCLRLEYSFLKSLDAFTYFGLLKIHNLTQTQQLGLHGIEFKPPRMTLKQLISNDSSSNNDSNTPSFLVGPAESRSIVLRVKDNLEGDEDSQPPVVEDHRGHSYLLLKWDFISGDSSIKNQSLANGNYKIRVRKMEASLNTTTA